MAPKKKEDGQWVEIGDESGGGDYEPAGYAWDKTFTDYSWLTDADANGTLNVEKVTTVEPYGSGSLDDAVNNADSYPTVVVFEVGGVIDLNDGALELRNSQVWIAGETAPDPGISIIRGSLELESDECIVSHIGVYPGDDLSSETDAISGASTVTDNILDHCTAMWGSDENVGFTDPCPSSSVLNCIIAEGLYDSIHPEGTHSRGLLFNNAADEVTVAGCLFAHNNYRNPLNRTDGFIVNNYIYNWGSGCIHHDVSDPTYTSIGHYVEDGANTYSGSDRPVHRYSAELYYDDIHTVGVDRDIVDSSVAVLRDPPVVPPDVDIDTDLLPATSVKDWAIGQAGMRPANRPPVDSDLVTNRLDDDHGRIDSQEEVGGYPSYSTTTRSLSVPSTGIVDWIKNDHTGIVEGTV